MNNPYLLTLPQLMTAKKKIGKVAAFFDPMKTSLRGFESTVLTPTQFREQLRRGLDILVTDAELGALVFLFDKTGDGVVDSIEFKNEFFRLGKQERTKFLTTQAEETKRIAEWKAKLHEMKAKKFENFTYTRVATTWTQEQENEAIRKIAAVSFSYDPIKGGLRVFMGSPHLTASEFRELMRRNFECYLSPEETGALLSMFDKDGLGLIDCKEFIFQFFRIGQSEKEAHLHRNQSITTIRHELEKERVATIEEKYARQVVARLTPATEKDKQSAFEKIRNAAMCYKGDSAFSGNLWKSFESDALHPTAFKSLLKTNFEILLSPGELDAVVGMFDANGDGSISCVEFITTFFRIALNERSHRFAIKREKDLKAIMEREEMERQKATSAAAATQTRVVWPVLPDENGEFSEEVLGAGAGAGAGGAASPGPAISDVRTIMKHRARPSMQQILSPIRGGGGGGGGAGGAKGSSSRGGSGRGGTAGTSLAELFPKASRDTKDFLMQLEAQEREIRLMGQGSQSLGADGFSVGSQSRGSKSSKGAKGAKRSKGGGKSKSKSEAGAASSSWSNGNLGRYANSGDEEEVEVVGEENEIVGGGNLMDSSWGFASSSANVNMIPGEFGGASSRSERPGTSAGNEWGRERAASSAGGSRGHAGGGAGPGTGGGPRGLQAPIEEEFGSVTDAADIPILAAEVVDES